MTKTLSEEKIKMVTEEIESRCEAYDSIFDPIFRDPWAYEKIRKSVYFQYGLTGNEKLLPCRSIGRTDVSEASEESSNLSEGTE